MIKKGLRIFLSSLFLFITAALGYGQDFSFDASLFAGLKNINSKEELLKDINQKEERISLLQWKTDIVPYFELESQLAFTNKFFINLKGFYTLPLSTRSMKDYDWMNIYSTGGKELTHFSSHDNKLDFFYDTELAFGVGGRVNSKVRLIQFLSFKYSYSSFTATGGYRQYGKKIKEEGGKTIYSPWSDQLEKKLLEGKIVNWESQSLFAGLGTKILYNPAKSFNLELFINLLPAIMDTSLDTHYIRTLYTYFDFTSKLELDSWILIEYKLNNSNCLAAKLGFSAVTCPASQVFQSEDKSNWTGLANTGKYSSCCWSFALGYTYKYEK